MKRTFFLFAFMVLFISANAQSDFGLHATSPTGLLNLKFYAVDVNNLCGGVIGITNTITIPALTTVSYNYSAVSGCMSPFPSGFWATDPATCSCTWNFAYVVVTDACNNSWQIGDCNSAVSSYPNNTPNGIIPCGTPSSWINPAWTVNLSNVTSGCVGNLIASFDF